MIPSALNWYNTGVTVTLGELLESGVDIWKGCNYPTPDTTYKNKFGDTLTLFDKGKLEKKIENHYYFREIGQETPARFIHYLHTRMQEIMPYYCQLYEFELTFRGIEDKLESYHLEETLDKQTTDKGSLTGTSSGTSNSSDTSNTNGTKKFSNTPQGSVENLDNYLTEATVDNGSASTTSNVSTSGTSKQDTEGTGSEKYTLIRRGNIGVQPLGTEVENIRHAFINIDLMIIEELKDLFLKVY